jgi:putative transposon-encoded protein
MVVRHTNIYIYRYIIVYMGHLKLEKGKIELKDEYEIIFEKKITKFGNGAKIDAPKEFLGRKVYVIIRK